MKLFKNSVKINDCDRIIEYNDKYKLYLRTNSLDLFVAGEMMHAYKNLMVDSNTVLFDLGANIGAFAHKWGPLVKQIISYEPEENNFRLLKKNTEDLKNIVYVQAAIGMTEDKERVFYKNNRRNTCAHSLYISRGRDIVTVPAINFDKEVEKYQPNVVKMDIEGGEFEIILGSCFHNCIKEIIFEVHFVKKRWIESYQLLLNTLEKHNFKPAYSIPERKKGWLLVLHYRR